MNFTLKQLRYFVKAGELGSVTRAAEALFVSQPSISSAILHLEEVTGLQLFVRHHAQGLSLSPAGRKFIRKAKQLLADAEGLGQYANTLGEEVAGTLRIVGFPTFTPMLLPSLMRKFIETYPEADILCDESHQKDIIQSLTDGRYELALTYDLQIPADIDFDPVMEFPVYAVLSQSHPLAQCSSLDLRELAEYPMVLLDWPMTREYFFSLFLSQDIDPDFKYRVQTLGMVRGLVSNNFGYTLFNTPLVNQKSLDGNDLVALPLSNKLRPLRMGVARVAQMKPTPLSQAFIEILKQHAAELPKTVFPPLTQNR